MGGNRLRRSFVPGLCLLGMMWISAPREAASAPPTPGDQLEYVLRPGESLIQVAHMFHVRAEDLASSNGITNASRLQVGQSLAVPNPFASQVAALVDERAELLEHARQRDIELAALHAAAADVSITLGRASSDVAQLRQTIDSTADWHHYAMISIALFGAVLGWALSLSIDHNRAARRVEVLEKTNALLAESKHCYRSAVSQLELRYQKLHMDRGHASHVQAEEGSAALRRIFSESAARIETLLEDLERARAAETTDAKPRTMFASLTALRLATPRHWLGSRTS